MTTTPGRTKADARRRETMRRDVRSDRVFFGLAWLALLWLAWLLVRQAESERIGHLLLTLPLVLVTLYIAIPRAHRILSSLYVPNYFFGRSRTGDGLVGDPVNIAIDGTARQLHEAFTRAGWQLSDPITLRSSVRIAVAAVLSRSYPTAPISPLLLFGRPQDLAYQQQVDDTPRQRHHVRLWRTPDYWKLPGGRHVRWMADASFDVSTGLSMYTFEVTHHIAPDIDAERDHVVETLRTAEPSIGADMLLDFTCPLHSRNGGGDPVYTDGDLPVLDLASVAEAPEADLPEQVVTASHGHLDDLAAGELASGDGPGEHPTRPAPAGPPPTAWWYTLVAMVVLLALQSLYAWRIAGRGAPGFLRDVLPEQADGLFVGVMAASIALAAVLGAATLVGVRRARIGLMALLCLMFATQEIERMVAHARDESWLAMMIIAVGVLALLFVSGEPVMRWTAHRERDRALRRAGGGAGGVGGGSAATGATTDATAAPTSGSPAGA